MTNHGIRRWVMACAMVLVLPYATAGAQGTNVPVVTGVQWTAASMEEKRAFLLGMTAVLRLQARVLGDRLPENARGFAGQVIGSLDEVTVPAAILAVDRWYEENAGQVDRTVADVVWFELIESRR